MRKALNKIDKEPDINSFRSLFLTFGPKVRAMLLRQGADSATADDIVQDTMLAVWSKSHLFSSEKGAISTWIYTIARNLRIDRVRRQVIWEQFCGEFEKLHGGQSAVIDLVNLQQEQLQITKALAALPKEQSQVIHLSFMEGLSQNEIAQRLELPLGTVKSRMRLAFEKLRSTVESRV